MPQFNRSMSCFPDKQNTKIHFTLDIPLYKVLPSHFILRSAAKRKKKKEKNEQKHQFSYGKKKSTEQQLGQVGKHT